MRTSLPRRRIALVGLGMAVNKHVLALRDLADRTEVVACWSPSPARRQDFTTRYRLPVVDSLAAIFDDASIDLVFILSPPWSHLELVERCARAGKHVLLEKPVEATLQRAEQLVRLCHTDDIKLGVVFQNRFRSPHLRLRALLADGTLGRPISTSLTMRWWRPDSYFAEGDRGMKSRDGGGVLLSQAIHTMDQLVDLFGVPTEVCGFHATSQLRRIDTEDVVAGALRWSNGAVGTLDATTTSFPTIPERIDIAAEHGSATLERTRLRVWLRDGTTIDDEEDAASPAVIGDYLAHRRLIADLLDALDHNRQPSCSGESALGVHRLIDALMRPRAFATAERV
jgi:UDP-N-acetyl-2-amino-2-deoxyglucuronate dehydrogenase